MAMLMMEKKKVKYQQPQTVQTELQIIQKYHQVQRQTFRQITLEEEAKKVQNLITNFKEDLEQNEIYLTKKDIEDTRKQIEEKEEKIFLRQLGFSNKNLRNESNDVSELTKCQADLHQKLPKIKWKVQDQCRAVYCGDGKYHEGIIKSIKYGKADVYFTDLKLEQSSLVTKLEISGKVPFPHHSLEMTYDMSSEERTKVTFEYFCRYMDITKNEVSNRNKIYRPTLHSGNINTTNRQRSHVILQNMSVTSGREIKKPPNETKFEPLATPKAKQVALQSQRPITNEHGSILNDNTSIAKKPRNTLEINMTDTHRRPPNRFGRNPYIEPNSSRPIFHDVEKANGICNGNSNNEKSVKSLVRTKSSQRSLKKTCCPHLVFFLIIVGIIVAPFIYIYLNFVGIL